MVRLGPIATPNRNDTKTNQVWVVDPVETFTKRSPGPYMIADSFLKLDSKVDICKWDLFCSQANDKDIPLQLFIHTYTCVEISP